MNNEIKYIVQGCLMVVLLLVGGNIIRFFYYSYIDHASIEQNQPRATNYDALQSTPVDPYSFAGSVGAKLF